MKYILNWDQHFYRPHYKFTMSTSKNSLLSNRVLSGYCPDLGCQTKLVFPSYESSIECTNCGERHEQKALREMQEVTDPNVVLHNMLRNILLNETTAKRGTEAVKVLGLSNYHCKLLAPILTRQFYDGYPDFKHGSKGIFRFKFVRPIFKPIFLNNG